MSTHPMKVNSCILFCMGTLFMPINGKCETPHIDELGEQSEEMMGNPATTNWITFLGNTEAYQKLVDPELELVGYAVVGKANPGHPEQIPWLYSLEIDNPWIPYSDVALRNCTNAWDRLIGQPKETELIREKVLIKAKLKRDRSQGKYPIVVPGSMRLAGECKANEELWWNLNMALLPVDRAYFPIPVIIACESVSEAEISPSWSGYDLISQDFKVLESFRGNTRTGEIVRISYECPTKIMRPMDNIRAIDEGKRIIWVCTSTNSGYGAVADTLRNRNEARALAAKMKSTPIPTRWDLLDLDFSGANVSTHLEKEVPELFEENPAGSGDWELRATVIGVYSGPDGAVYYLPNEKVYFYRWDIYDWLARRVSYYFGPYDHDKSLIKKIEANQPFEVVRQPET